MTQSPTRQELETFLKCPEAQDDLLSVRMARELLRLMDAYASQPDTVRCDDNLSVRKTWDDQ